MLKSENRDEEERIVRNLIKLIGDDPNREGLKETPRRFLEYWKEMNSGSVEFPEKIFTCFDEGPRQGEIVLVKDMPFHSLCEHHLAPFFGTATIAYLPERKIIGLSKLGRILRIYSRRLQMQERLTVQIAETLEKGLEARGVAVLIKARHLCMECRGVNMTGQHTVTSKLLGLFLTEQRYMNYFFESSR